MRKLLMLATMALAAMAVMATPSFAANPDFPLDDYDADHWFAVNVSGDPLSGLSASCEGQEQPPECGATFTKPQVLPPAAPPYSYAATVSCNAYMAAELSSSGELSNWGWFGDGVHGQPCPGTFGGSWESPLTGTICAHSADGNSFTAWLRQDVEFDMSQSLYAGFGGQPDIVGEAFAVAVDSQGDPVDPSGDPVYGWTFDDVSIGAGPWAYDASYTPDPSDYLSFEPEGDPCPWPELQA